MSRLYGSHRIYKLDTVTSGTSSTNPTIVINSYVYILNMFDAALGAINKVAIQVTIDFYVGLFERIELSQ